MTGVPPVELQLAGHLQRALSVEREPCLHRPVRPPSRGNMPISQANDGDDITQRGGRRFTVVRAKQLGPISGISATVRLHPLGDHDAIVAEQRHIDPVLGLLNLDFEHALNHPLHGTARP